VVIVEDAFLTDSDFSLVSQDYALFAKDTAEQDIRFLTGLLFCFFYRRLLASRRNERRFENVSSTLWLFL